MTLPFTLILRGHYRVINWPNLRIVVYQERGKSKERDGGTPDQGSIQNPHILQGHSSQYP